MQPGVVLSERIARRMAFLRPVLSAFLFAVGALTLGMSVAAIASGHATQTTRVRGIDMPQWMFAILGLALMGWVVWEYRRDASAHATKILVGVQARAGGINLVGNYGDAKGMSVPVADNSSLSIQLVRTRRVAYGLVSLYGLRFTSMHGEALMRLNLKPEALEFGPLLDELSVRSVAVTLDAAVAARVAVTPRTPAMPTAAPQGMWPAAPSGAHAENYGAHPGPVPHRQSTISHPPAPHGWNPN